MSRRPFLFEAAPGSREAPRDRIVIRVYYRHAEEPPSSERAEARPRRGNARARTGCARRDAEDRAGPRA